jgi:hypothetical protein
MMAGKPASAKNACASTAVIALRAAPTAATTASQERADPAQQLLDLGEGLLDGIEVRGIGRQEEELTPGGFDEGLGAGTLVHREIVQDHDLPGPQARHQHPLHKGFEHVSIDGAPHQEALADAAKRQRG